MATAGRSHCSYRLPSLFADSEILRVRLVSPSYRGPRGRTMWQELMTACTNCAVTVTRLETLIGALCENEFPNEAPVWPDAPQSRSRSRKALSWLMVTNLSSPLKTYMQNSSYRANYTPLVLTIPLTPTYIYCAL